MSQPHDEPPIPPGPNGMDHTLPQPADSSGSQPAHHEMLGERLRAARYAARLTQEGLAGDTFSKSYISAVERSKMTPSIPALRLLAERLGVTLAYLLGEEPLNLEASAQAQPADQDEFAQRLSEAERLLLHDDVQAALEQLGSQETTATFSTAYQANWHRLYAWALRRQGRTSEVEAVVAQGLEAAQASQDHRSEGYLYLTRALATAGHDDKTAEQAFQQAIAIGERIGDNALLFRGHGEYGAFLAERGRYQEAYEHISHSQTASSRLGSNC